MSEADWALFRATGTVHLMVISGLHLRSSRRSALALGRALARLSPLLLARMGRAWPGMCLRRRACNAVLRVSLAGAFRWFVRGSRPWLCCRFCRWVGVCRCR